MAVLRTMARTVLFAGRPRSMRCITDSVLLLFPAIGVTHNVQITQYAAPFRGKPACGSKPVNGILLRQRNPKTYYRT
jgi:hypothetical protein